MPPNAVGQDPPTRSPKVLNGGPDGGGTFMVIGVPAEGWAEAAQRLLAERPKGTVLTYDCVGRPIEVHACRADGGIQLRAPGRAILAIQPDHARLVMPSAAVERFGVDAWLDRWPAWASRLLLGRDLVERTDLHAAGWRTGGLDLHVDAACVEIPDAWVVLADAWTGRSARGRRPHPDGYDAAGRLIGLWLGQKVDGPRGRACSVSFHAYNKSLHQRETCHPSPDLDATWKAAGYDPEADGDVWRFEASLRDDALQLRSPDGEWNLEDPASWASSSAITAAWAYVVGTPSHRASGVIRLTDPTDASREPKRRRVHPLWEVLRSVAAAAPTERLTQARASIEVEQALRLERAEARVGRALGQLAGVAGAAETPSQAAGFAVAVVPKITRRDDWSDHVSAGRVDHADLHELDQQDQRDQDDTHIGG